MDEFRAFRVTADDCAGERRWMWMIGEAACRRLCEGIVIISMRSSAARISRTFSLGMDGVFRVPKDVDALEAETERRPGTAAEKTYEGLLMRW